MNNAQLQQQSAVSLPIVILFFAMSALITLSGALGALPLTTAAGAEVVLVVLLLLFYRLCVTVSQEQVVVSYGVGLVRQELDIHKIVELEIIPNRSLAALYNPTAENVLYAVDRFGNALTIGLFEPRQLLGYLRSRGIS